MAQKRYIVEGNHDGMRVKKLVDAFSSKQAKLKAGFESRLGGNDLRRFVNSRQIKVRQVK